MRTPPATVANMTPAEAWTQGYRDGREDLAVGVQADALAREHAEARTPERLATVEAALRALQGNDADQARQLAELMKWKGQTEGTR